MQQTSDLRKKKAPWPAYAPWLLGYAGVLAMAAGLVYFWRVVFLLPPELPAVPFTLAVMGLFSLLYAAFFLITRLKSEDLCLRAALLVFMTGLLFVFATAPLQAPDENKHYLRAVAISQGHFNYDYTIAYPNDVDLLVEYFSPPQARAMNHHVVYGGGELAFSALSGYRQALAENRPATEKAAAPEMFLLIPFLHQAFLMALARLFGFSALGLLYAGRIANLALYTWICYRAFKIGPQFRTVLFAMALLPISLFMGASCSYDGLVLALCYLLAAYAGKEHFTQKDLGIFVLALSIATYIKPNNFLLAGMLLLLPAARFGLRRRAWQYALGSSAIALAFWWLLGKLDGSVLRIGWPPLARGSGDAADTLGQMKFILSHPTGFAARALLSFYEADGFLFDLGRFGWMDLVIPLVGGFSVIALLLAAVLGARQDNSLQHTKAPGFALIAFLYSAAILAGMYVTDTDLFSIRITGQQPRYFLPAFALIFMCLLLFFSKALRPRIDGSKHLALLVKNQKILLYCCVLLALTTGILLLQNYYIGQWIPKSEGGWKLVNLFGWVQK